MRNPIVSLEAAGAAGTLEWTGAMRELKSGGDDRGNTMRRDARYDVLFEQVEIGPVVAPNRFYQVPHSSGLGHLYANASAELRTMKAEGGWGVVSTGACEIHYTSDHLPRPYDRLWDESDVAVHARMVEGVHKHGSLAAVQLTHVGISSLTFYSRTPAIGPGSLRSREVDMPSQSREMDKDDIRAYRKWHREAALRAKRAGFDIVYVYAAHGSQVPQSFLNREHNHRSDEYGGSLENRARLLRELLIDTKEAVGDKCAVALRFSVDDTAVDRETYQREAKEVVEYLAELPDLWDVNVAPWPSDSVTSRFGEEGFQEPFVAFVKKLTTKPVVGVGRFTSPDTMVSQIKRGILDLIGAARPSIADPFLPTKIQEGRLDDIRECIGCNVCVSVESYGAPLQCTQNPTIGEEWRRKWHPEKIPPRRSDSRILVVGSGPAGLECAVALGRRGYNVALAESRRELGGRVTLESRLPGLSAWARVRDYRLQQLEKLDAVEAFRESALDVQEIVELQYENVVLATGSRWRDDGIGGSGRSAIPGIETAARFTPDDVMAGADLPSPVLIYDDDHNYMASVLAERMLQQGKEVLFVTPKSEVASWTRHTLEHARIYERLLNSGATVHRDRKLQEVSGNSATLAHTYTSREEIIEFASILLVTSRQPNDGLYRALDARRVELTESGIKTVSRIGDCLAPALIATAVFAGHEFARNFEEQRSAELPFLREP